MTDLLPSFRHVVETMHAGATSDVERFHGPAAAQARYREIVEGEPETIFAALVLDGRPVASFRRDRHPSISSLSPERQARAIHLCQAAEVRLARRAATILPAANDR